MRVQKCCVKIEKRKYDDNEVAYVRFRGNRTPYLAYIISRIRVADEDKVMDRSTYEDMLLNVMGQKPRNCMFHNILSMMLLRKTLKPHGKGFHKNHF